MYIFKTKSAVILLQSLVFLDWSSKGVTPVSVLALSATAVVIAYVAKYFYKKVVITIYYLKWPRGMRHFQFCQFWQFNLYEAI